MATLLILGGTSEAAALAAAISAEQTLHVITSLAGRTARPRRLPGEVRSGGFGGVDGLIRFLRERHVDAVIDATHPFAEQMSRHGDLACRDLGLPKLCLTRPAWVRQDDDRWHEVPDIEAAAACLPSLGIRVFLTSGHRDLGAFSGLDDLWFLIRTVEPVEGIRPKHCCCLQAKGPFAEADEIALLKRHRIDVLVTKASGGKATYGKIAAARQLRLPILMIKRPDLPPGPSTDSLDEARTWLRQQVND